MTDRSYGIHHHSLDGVQERFDGVSTVQDLVAHLRELLAEIATLQKDNAQLSDRLASVRLALKVSYQSGHKTA